MLYLDALLASLCSQPSAELEVVVFDNDSGDATRSVVCQYASDCAFPIKYIKNDFNVGGNKNIAIASRGGEGKYVWVLGDDELIPDGAIFKILSYLRAGPDYVILNHSVFDREMKVVKISRWHRFSEDQVISGRDRSMELLGPTPTFISAVIAMRGILDGLSADAIAKYSELGFNQLYAFYSGLPENSKGIATEEVLLYARGNNSGTSYDWNRYFVTGLGVIFRDLKLREGYADKSVKVAMRAVLIRYLIPRALNEAAEGRNCRNLRELAFAYHRRSLLYWLVFIPSTFLPAFVMGPLKRVKKKMML